VEGSCEHGNEPSGSLKNCWEVFEWLHNWWLLKKCSAPEVNTCRRGGVTLKTTSKGEKIILNKPATNRLSYGTA
jgi:hypothetical protein